MANQYQMLLVVTFLANMLSLEGHARAFRMEFEGKLLEHKK